MAIDVAQGLTNHDVKGAVRAINNNVRDLLTTLDASIPEHFRSDLNLRLERSPIGVTPKMLRAMSERAASMASNSASALAMKRSSDANHRAAVIGIVKRTLLEVAGVLQNRDNTWTSTTNLFAQIDDVLDRGHLKLEEAGPLLLPAGESATSVSVMREIRRARLVFERLRDDAFPVTDKGRVPGRAAYRQLVDEAVQGRVEGVYAALEKATRTAERFEEWPPRTAELTAAEKQVAQTLSKQLEAAATECLRIWRRYYEPLDAADLEAEGLPQLDVSPFDWDDQIEMIVHDGEHALLSVGRETLSLSA